ncbi:hypothetical protein RHSIM_Rhsim02G0100000 [Rhododendron simsii]|uniref:Uncharacterized protein n=1 Tax=Rhododendron simsii TaxID=118357 RepID=A0A834LWR6_RHOSS|nr:hypothetical protein RHSIM_Rhsim02G0100000 [Rhododendron simsii]
MSLGSYTTTVHSARTRVKGDLDMAKGLLGDMAREKTHQCGFGCNVNKQSSPAFGDFCRLIAETSQALRNADDFCVVVEYMEKKIYDFES